MWKWTRGEESKPAPPSGIGTTTPPLPRLTFRPQNPCRRRSRYRWSRVSADVTHIGNSILIKSELSGSESVYLNGELEGSVELRDGSLTVGPNGRIRANVEARNIVLHGRVDGNLYGSERVELKKSAVVVGDINTPRITIEGGAYLKGNVQIQKDIPSPQTKKDDTPGPHSSDLPSSAP